MSGCPPRTTSFLLSLQVVNLAARMEWGELPACQSPSFSFPICFGCPIRKLEAYATTKSTARLRPSFLVRGERQLRLTTAGEPQIDEWGGRVFDHQSGDFRGGWWGRGDFRCCRLYKKRPDRGRFRQVFSWKTPKMVWRARTYGGHTSIPLLPAILLLNRQK
jgi:hypothetical protein